MQRRSEQGLRCEAKAQVGQLDGAESPGTHPWLGNRRGQGEAGQSKEARTLLRRPQNIQSKVGVFRNSDSHGLCTETAKADGVTGQVRWIPI